MMIFLRLRKILISLHQDPTPTGSPAAPMNARGPRSVWPRNAIPILGQFPHLTPLPRDGTARLQAPPPAYCRQPMTGAILENPLARPAAAIARPARARAA